MCSTRKSKPWIHGGKKKRHRWNFTNITKNLGLSTKCKYCNIVFGIVVSLKCSEGLATSGQYLFPRALLICPKSKSAEGHIFWFCPKPNKIWSDNFSSLVWNMIISKKKKNLQNVYVCQSIYPDSVSKNNVVISYLYDKKWGAFIHSKCMDHAVLELSLTAFPTCSIMLAFLRILGDGARWSTWLIYLYVLVRVSIQMFWWSVQFCFYCICFTL